VLTSMLGAQPDLDVTVQWRPLGRRERLVLTTDGVHGALDDESIAQIVGNAGDTASAAEGLVAAALDRDGSDNLTAVVVEVSSDSRS
jgi:serine/threonine protein phosphatase PrpC